jgi:hypothetical protein
MSSTAELVARMAQALAGAGVDLGDEKACIRALHAKHFTSAEIIIHGDRAAKAAGQQILIVKDPNDQRFDAARGMHADFAVADIVIHNGIVVKDRDGVFDGLAVPA